MDNPARFPARAVIFLFSTAYALVWNLTPPIQQQFTVLTEILQFREQTVDF